MLVNLLTRVQVRHLLCVSKTLTQRRQLSIHLALSLVLPHLLLIQFFQFIIFKLSMHKEGEEACAFRASDLDTKLFCLVTSNFSFSSHSLLFVHTFLIMHVHRGGRGAAPLEYLRRAEK